MNRWSGQAKRIKLIQMFFICIFSILSFSAQARRAKNIYSPLLDKLYTAIPEVEISLWDATDPKFFRENWITLEGGIRVEFSNGSFLEIRRTDEQLIAQLIGLPSHVEWVIFKAIKEDLDKVSVAEHYIPVTFYNFYDLDINNEALEAYSILNISADYFEIIVKDMIVGGNGSGLKVASDYSLSTNTAAILELVEETKEAIDSAVYYGFFDVSWLNLNKRGLVSLLEETVSVIPEIEYGFVGPDYLEIQASKELSRLKMNILRALYVLEGSWGDLIYRILHREHIRELIKLSIEV